MSKTRTNQAVSIGPDYAQRISMGRHSLLADEPASLGGQDAGPAPFDLYLAALSSCTVITLQMYAKRKGWDLGKVSADLALTFTDDGQPQVHRTLRTSTALTEAQSQKLLEIAAKTPVTRALGQGAAITSSLAHH